jgi:hypothetical protein
MKRIVLVASLKTGMRKRVLELLEEQAEQEPITTRQGIFLSETEVVFFFEGDGAEEAVRDALDDPVRATAIGPWLPLFTGPLHRGYEALFVEDDAGPTDRPVPLGDA